MITRRGQHIHLIERMSGVIPPKVTLARSALILTNTHIFTFGGARRRRRTSENGLCLKRKF